MRQDDDSPVFSVVITCFNKASCIERAVNSAKCATPKTEVIVIDDYSTDDSREVIVSLDIDQKFFIKPTEGPCRPILLACARRAASIW